MEYTKGGWKLKGNKIEISGSGVIAVCPSPTTSDGVMDFIANAHLIAAAPAMYEALEAAEKALEYTSPVRGLVISALILARGE